MARTLCGLDIIPKTRAYLLLIPHLTTILNLIMLVEDWDGVLDHSFEYISTVSPVILRYRLFIDACLDRNIPFSSTPS